jgi:hypothetical protein
MHRPPTAAIAQDFGGYAATLRVSQSFLAAGAAVPPPRSPRQPCRRHAGRSRQQAAFRPHPRLRVRDDGTESELEHRGEPIAPIGNRHFGGQRSGDEPT